MGGCATQKFTQEKDKFSHLKDIAIVVDATVTHGRTMKGPLLSVSENEAIAARLGTIAADALRVKGYSPLPPVRAVGMASPAQLEVAFGNSAEPAATKPSSPPFLVAPASNQVSADSIRGLFKKIEVRQKANYSPFKGLQTEEWLPREANPFGATPVVLISAQGNFVSGGSVAANVGKGAVNTLLVIGMVVGGKGGDKLLEMDKDNLAITFRLFDSVTGVLVWEDQIKESGNADETNFAREMSKMLDKLPNVAN
jgi:hypothetical protein